MGRFWFGSVLFKVNLWRNGEWCLSLMQQELTGGRLAAEALALLNDPAECW